MVTRLGNQYANILDGTDGRDELYGFDNNDELYGNGDDDFLKGGGGADYLHGGAGYDTADYSDSNAEVYIYLAPDGMTGHGYGGTAEGDRLVSIEDVSGSIHGDYLHGNGRGNVLLGEDGNDHLYGFAGDDALYGGRGDDWLEGGQGRDFLVGGPGIDTASYASSTDGVIVSLMPDPITGMGFGLLFAIYGGDGGGDTLYQIENLVGSGGYDSLVGDDNANIIDGLGGGDQITGYGGSDQLLGGEGRDRLDGQDGVGGNDLLVGGPGDDLYLLDLGDTLVELPGGGRDGIFIPVDGYTLPANFEDLWFEGVSSSIVRGAGNASDNEIGGSEFANRLDGLAGNDTLHGFQGADTLLGGEGRDTLEGGWANDQFVWTLTTETGTTEATADVILDFNVAEGDRIHLSAIDADIYADGNQTFRFIGPGAFSGKPGEINYYHAGGNTYVQLQTGTSTDLEAVIRLDGILVPEASWFVL